MKVNGINHVTVIVSDKEKAIAFYSDILKLEVYLVDKSTWMRVGKQFIHLTQNSASTNRPTFQHFAIEVDSFHEYIDSLVKLGVEVFDLDDDLHKIMVNTQFEASHRQFFVSDPDNNLIEIIPSNSEFFNPNT